MALRLIEIYHRQDKADEIDYLLKGFPLVDTWHQHLEEDKESVTKVLLMSEHTDSVINALQDYFPNEKLFRVVIMHVEATLPRPEKNEEKKKAEEASERIPKRIGMEELYQKMLAVSDVSPSYIVMTVLAAFVAALGLLKNDVAVIIGSMVISPLLYPSKALALATTLADPKLAGKALKANVAGFSIVMLVGILMGVVMDIDPTIPQIAARSDVRHFYIFVAMATGIAGAYSITTGVVEALVGVMVAVALLPPLVVAGLLFGGQYWLGASGALILSMVNFVCINLSGVITFIVQGIRPQKWAEAKKAKRSVKIAVAVWMALLILLVIMIYIEQRFIASVR